MSLSSKQEHSAVPAVPVKQKFALPENMVAELTNSLPGSTGHASTKNAQAPKLPVTSAAKPVLSVSNAEYVSVVFGTLREGTFAATCSKKGDPTSGNWFAMTAGPIDLQAPSDRNNYINLETAVEAP